jgi:hypothetical protein
VEVGAAFLKAAQNVQEVKQTIVSRMEVGSVVLLQVEVASLVTSWMFFGGFAGGISMVIGYVFFKTLFFHLHLLGRARKKPSLRTVASCAVLVGFSK